MNINNFIGKLDNLIIGGEVSVVTVANEHMIITKDAYRTLWYEDENGNYIETDMDLVEPEKDNPKITYQVSRFPLKISETHLKLIKQEDVDKCDHPAKFIVPTYGWIDGVEGRECLKCHGTQTRKVEEPWPDKWNGYGSRNAFTGTCNLGRGSEKTLLGMANSGDYTLSEAILVYSQACERCMNVLSYQYTNGEEGYPIYSDEWMKCNTSCKFCEHENVGRVAELFGVTKDVPNDDSVGVIPPFDPERQMKKMKETDKDRENEYK